MAGDERSGDTVVDGDAEPADVRRHDGDPTGLRLDGHESEALRVAGDTDQIRRAVHLREPSRRLRREERDRLRDTEFACEVDEGGGPGQPGPGRSADDEQSQATAVTDERGDRAQQHVGGLERLDAADEGHDGLVGGEIDAERSHLGARPGARPGSVDLEVDTGCRDVDAAGVGVVERDELARLGVGVRDQTVGLVDDLLLPDLPQHRLGLVAGGEGRVLHRREGVRGVDERDAPAIAGEPPDLT